MFNGNLKNVSILKLIKNPAVLLIHKFTTEHTELVNQQIIFMKTTIEWVYRLRNKTFWWFIKA